MNLRQAHDLWRRFVNPDFVQLLETLDFGRCFVRAKGAKLYDDTGREYTDLLAGFGVHNVGHNHPRVVGALRRALESDAASMLNIDAAPAAGLLAERLTAQTHPALCRCLLANSGAEATDAAIKAARAATGRDTIVACHGAYHGLSPGSLSLMGAADVRGAFGPLLAGVHHVPFGDGAALDEACRRLRPAAFFVEPVQAEGGIRIPAPDYLAEASVTCRAHGCLLVVDEIQTGLGRTGRNFATDFEAVRPDVLLVGKALSGGLVPVAAAILTAETWAGAFAGPARCRLGTSTFAGGVLAATAAIETLSVLDDEGLADRASDLGSVLLSGLRDLAARHEVIEEVRGQGLLAGIEFRRPSGLLTKAVPRWAREGLYANVISALLLRDHGFVTQPCGLDPGVLRVEPPLVIAREDIERFLAALDRTLAAYPSHNSATFAAFRKSILGRNL